MPELTIERQVERTSPVIQEPSPINEHLGKEVQEKQSPDPTAKKCTKNATQYLLQVNGDPEFVLKANSARRGGVKAEYTAAGWVYQNKKDIEEVAKRWDQGERKICAVRWFDLRVDAVWNGKKSEAAIAKKEISLEIDNYRRNKKKGAIELQCHASGLHASWLRLDKLPDDMSDQDKKVHAYFKPFWDETFKEKERLDLRNADIEREKEDIEIEQKSAAPHLNIKTMALNSIVECLMHNERGDVKLFLMLQKDKYIFDSTEGRNGEFYLWTGSRWQLDRKKQRYKDMEVASEYYEGASIEVGKDPEKKELSSLLNKRAFALRSFKRCKAVFEFVATEVHFNNEWDHCPGKLPCLNGIIDLKTGELLEHKPEYYIRSICPTNFNPNAKRPLFERFLNDITLGDNELSGFLKRIFGAALIGNGKEEKVFIFYGANGRNGKGTLLQTLENVLGELAKTFPSEMLLLQRNPPSSSTPRPEKANLQGVRFAIFSEINKGRKIDASEVKNLSGRDTISCRRLFSNMDIQIKPSHTMFIQTNFKPEAPSDDGALWKRNVLFPFNAEFVEKPEKSHQRKLDEGFKEKLLEEREGILSWLVEGCLEYQKIGLNIPEIVRKETENYRKENDGIGRFLSEMCVEDPVFSTPKSKMTKAIKEFCTENGCAIPNRTDISNYLKAKFREQHTNKGDIWCGVKIVDESEFQG